jgi:hypothetical protein
MKRWICVSLLFVAAACQAQDSIAPNLQPPGVVIDHRAASTKIYIGSPALAILPDGRYVASHDEFGPGSAYRTRAVSFVFNSADRGRSWKQIARIDGMFWGSLFVHNNALYLMGTDKEYGRIVIRRSADGGKTWTETAGEKTGRLTIDDRSHCAPMPVVVHNGRVLRAMEDAKDPGGWGYCFRSFVISAPVDADLLDAASWTKTPPLSYDETSWKGKGWLEGNVVVDPQGNLLNILRVDFPDTAAIVRISPDGKTAAFDPQKDFLAMPGGAVKFTIRLDPKTRRYWSIVNPQTNPKAVRNRLALVSSADLRTWTIHKILFEHPDPEKHAWQYVDWLFEGDDIVLVSRTAFDDTLGGAHNYHDANYMTFHRLENFRTMAH